MSDINSRLNSRSTLLKAFLFTFLSFTCSIGYNYFINQAIYDRYFEIDESPNNTMLTQNDDYEDKVRRVQAKTAKFISIMDFIGAVPGLSSPLIIGTISDMYSRHFALIIIFIGHSIWAILSTFISLLHLPLWLYIVGSFIRNLCGGLLSITVLVNVWLSDITLASDDQASQVVLDRRRLYYLGIFDCVTTFAYVAAVIGVGVAIDHLGFTITSLALLSIFTINLAFLWCIPDTRTENLANVDHDSRVTGRPVIVTRLITEFNNIFIVFKTDTQSRIFINAIVFIIAVTTFTEDRYTFLYLMAPPFNFSITQCGIYNAAVAIMLGMASIPLIRIIMCFMKSTETVEPISSAQTGEDGCNDADELYKRFILHSGYPMLKYCIVGLLAGVVYKIMIGLAFMIPKPGPIVFLCIAVTICVVRASVLATLKSYLSLSCSPDIQGRLFALLGTVEYCGMMSGGVLFPYIYGVTVTFFPGFAYLLAAIMLLIGSALVCLILWNNKQRISSINTQNRILETTHLLSTQS